MKTRRGIINQILKKERLKKAVFVFQDGKRLSLMGGKTITQKELKELENDQSIKLLRFNIIRKDRITNENDNGRKEQ